MVATIISIMKNPKIRSSFTLEPDNKAVVIPLKNLIFVIHNILCVKPSFAL